jgi:carbonic anhydrase
MVTASDALKRLRKGNWRFVNGKNDIARSIGEARRAELVDGQKPFAVILACSDSRVPVELIFDQGLGELFVIRVAGNIVAPSQIGSIEYAAARLGVRLVVVLGHSNCGAVEATLQALTEKQEITSPHLRSIVESISPALEPLIGEPANVTLRKAVRANILQSVEQLQHASQLLEQLISSGDLTIVGAKYSIESGEVNFLDD